MNTNGTDISESSKTLDEGQCPVWCVRHERYDVGHPSDEGMVHVGRRRTYRGQALRLEQDKMLRDKRPGRVTLWLNDEELTPAQAKRLGQLLIDTAAGS